MDDNLIPLSQRVLLQLSMHLDGIRPGFATIYQRPREGIWGSIQEKNLSSKNGLRFLFHSVECANYQFSQCIRNLK